ncbi:FHA domain-containing protein [Candidatus Peregrinibacteria bacterium]|nr:MAG: FHA domain-containing protein [Candidatus Peregrinibacteria bacterium]
MKPAKGGTITEVTNERVLTRGGECIVPPTVEKVILSIRSSLRFPREPGDQEDRTVPKEVPLGHVIRREGVWVWVSPLNSERNISSTLTPLGRPNVDSGGLPFNDTAMAASEKHFSLQAFEDGSLRVTDLGSTNGTVAKWVTLT